MSKLIYSAITSLDGFIEDEKGKFDWAEPDDEVFAFVSELERTVGTYLFGRRMYETMAVWETDRSLAESSPLMREFSEIWKAADKIVYSTTLEETSTAKTRIERRFDPDAISNLKASAKQDIAIGGPGLAGHALRAGVVDECQMFLVPVSVGSGKPALPHDVRLELELLEERRFDSGFVYLRYQITL